MKSQLHKMTIQKIMLPLLVLIMFCAVIFACPHQVHAATTTPVIHTTAVTNLTRTNARLNNTISNPSGVRITRAGFILYDAIGNQLTRKYDSFSTTSTSFPNWYDMSKYYGTLKPNTTYKYKFFLMTASGQYIYSASHTFKTLANPNFTIRAVSNITSTDAQLNNTINNPAKVRLVKAGFILYDSNNRQLVNKYDSFSTTSTSFNNWYDMNKYYGTLKANTTYKYRFYTVTSAGTYYYSKIATFKTAATTPATTTGSSKTLKYDTDKIKEIGKQTTNKCSVYCISYCRAITNRTPYNNPNAYWYVDKNTGKAIGACWSWGGMKSNSYSTVQAALKAAYNQINAGKPCIIHIKNSLGGTHYVTIIGYQNVTNTSNLSFSNFRIIDPGYVSTGKETYSMNKNYKELYSDQNLYQLITF